MNQTNIKTEEIVVGGTKLTRDFHHLHLTTTFGVGIIIKMELGIERIVTGDHLVLETTVDASETTITGLNVTGLKFPDEDWIFHEEGHAMFFTEWAAQNNLLLAIKRPEWKAREHALPDQWRKLIIAERKANPTYDRDNWAGDLDYYEAQLGKANQ